MNSKKHIYRNIIYIVAALLLAALLSACSSSGEKYATVLGVDITTDKVKYLTLNYMSDMEAKYGEGIWETDAETYRAELEANLEEAIKKDAATRALLEEYDIDTGAKSVKSYVSETIKSAESEAGGSKAFKAVLEENHMTEDLLRDMLAVEKCKETLSEKLVESGAVDVSEETFERVLETEFIRTLHVFISNDEGDDIEENAEKAAKVLSLLEDGTPINKLIGRYSEDYYMVTTDGYYFMRGEYEEAYENAAFALDVGEHSGVVVGSDGFYIIVRLEPETEYLEENYDSLRDRYSYVKMQEAIAEKAAEAVIELTESGRALDLIKIKQGEV